VHDLVVQAKSKELVIGTHGRSMYKINIASLQVLTQEVMANQITLFAMENTRYDRGWGQESPWQSPEPVAIPFNYYVAVEGKAQWEVRTKAGLVLNSGTINSKKGLNTFTFDLSLQDSALKPYEKWLNETQGDKKPLEVKKADDGKYYLQKGVYTVELKQDGGTSVQNFTIE
jgi:hypothetical protein